MAAEVIGAALTLRDFERFYWDAREKGRQFVQLVISRRQAPRNWDRVRIVPGLYGKVRGNIEGTRYLADVTRDALGEWLVKMQAAEKRSTTP